MTAKGQAKTKAARAAAAAGKGRGASSPAPAPASASRLAAAALAALGSRAGGEKERALARTFFAALFAGGGEENLRHLDPAALAAAAARAYLRWRGAQGGSAGGVLEIFQAEASEAGLAPRRFLLCAREDAPFLVDSTLAALARCGVEPRLLLHPLYRVRRNGKGQAEAALSGMARAAEGGEERAGFRREAVLLVELSANAVSQGEELCKEVGEALADLDLAVADWGGMRERALSAAEELERAGSAGEEAAFLRWLAADHFTFLGALVGSGRGKGESEALGIFRRRVNRPRGAHEPQGRLAVWKAAAASRVHLDAPMDLIGVRLPPARPGGKPVFALFAGLFTSNVRFLDAAEIPVLRQKLARIAELAGLAESSHSGKSLRHILDSWPRDELFHLPAPRAASLAAALARLQDQPGTRAFLHYDKVEGLWHAVLALPKLHVSEALLRRAEEAVAQACRARPLSRRDLYDETPLVRVHLLLAGPPRRVRAGDLERALDDLLRSWQERLARLLVAERGEERAAAVLRRWWRRVPGEYAERCTPLLAAEELPWLDAELAAGRAAARIRLLLPDASRASALPGETPPESFAPDKDAEGARLSLRCFVPGAQLSLSDTLPVLERMGLKVRDEHAYHFCTSAGAEGWLYDFTLIPPPAAGTGAAEGAVPGEAVLQSVADCFVGTLEGRIEDDRFNALVFAAAMAPEAVAVLRALSRYLVQARFPAPAASLARTLCEHPAYARGLVELFRLRHDPGQAGRAGSKRAGEALAANLRGQLERVSDAAQDRQLRALLELLFAVVRCNYWQTGADAAVGKTLAFKLRPAELGFLPEPRPAAEIFVTAPAFPGPAFEGVHLRFGPVARGGLRWSDRPDDFRDEILGLAKAQQVKNAVIVPEGAKGGFALRAPPAEREAFLAAGTAAYEAFVSALLEVTDNRDSAGRAVAPEGVVCLDGPDPYLVVAADKGTAGFSDLANSVAERAGFWLGDAFASGGSAGYNHKDMGITARGAWESVRRHFRELGVNADRDPLLVAGVGDMSGDVFGNGMLLGRGIRLVAAFNHRWIFLDPDPDPEVQGPERRRLFKDSADWDAFDKSKLSPGGGVFPRGAKSLTLSAAAAKRLGLAPGRQTPQAVLRAILAAETDLLWFGGIGTYIRSSNENDADMADRANDAIRISGREVRAKVVAEGANLGATQAGRVEYAQAGGRINADFIDNSAGVDCSDHEVNIKILLREAEAQGRLSRPARNRALAAAEDEVARRVLRHNFLQVQSLSVMESLGPALNDRLRHVIRSLERRHGLDRRLAGLPDADAFEDRARRGLGLERPELAVLMALAKNALARELAEARLLDDPFLVPDLLAYFPPAFAGRREAILRHPLRRELVATILANGVGNRMGVAFTGEMEDRTGAGTEAILRAWLLVLALFDLPALWRAGEALAPGTGRADEAVFVEAARFAERATAWFLRRPAAGGSAGTSGDGGLSAEAAAYAAPVAALRAKGASLLSPAGARALAADTERLVARGVPQALAGELALLPRMVPAPALVDAARRFSIRAEDAARLYHFLGERFGHDWLRAFAAGVPRVNLWDKLSVQTVLERADALQIRLLEAVLAADARKSGGKAGAAGPAAMVASWQKANAGRVRAAEETLEELRQEANPRLSVLSLAAEQLEQLAG